MGWCSLHSQAPKPRHSKCQSQEQESSHEGVLDLLNNQRWEKHQKRKKVYHQEKAKSTPKHPTQLTTCGQQGSNRGSSSPSPGSWALLELRELFLIHEPTASRNLAPWQQLGTESLKRSSSQRPPELGLPSPVTSCKAVWGSKCQDWWEEAISSFFLWCQPLQRTHTWLQAPSSGATVPCHCGRSGASVQNCSAGQASSETAAARVQP